MSEPLFLVTSLGNALKEIEPTLVNETEKADFGELVQSLPRSHHALKSELLQNA